MEKYTRNEAKTSCTQWYIRSGFEHDNDNLMDVHTTDNIEEHWCTYENPFTIELRRQYYYNSTIGFGDTYANTTREGIDEKFDDREKVPQTFVKEFNKIKDRLGPGFFSEESYSAPFEFNTIIDHNEFQG